MAFEQVQTRLSGVAAAGVSPANQFCAVSLDPNGNVALAGAGKNCMGILQDKPQPGQTCTVAISGVSKGEIAGGQTIVIGSLLEVGANGQLVLHAAGTVVAQAHEAMNAAAAKTITVRLLPNNSAF